MRVPALFLLAAFSLQAASPVYPPELGQKIMAYEDGFNSSERREAWLARGADVFTQQNGVMRFGPAAGDPNHLVLQLPYNDTNQEILARIRVMSVGWGDAPRGGVGVGVGGDSR